MRKMLFILYSVFSCVYASQIITVKFNSTEIPVKLMVKGKVVESLKWQDKTGTHFIIITEDSSNEYCSKGYKSALYARQYTRSDSFSVNWSIQDFGTNDCEKAHYLDSSLLIIDIDNDSIAETRFIYELAHDCCDPVVVKYMLHYKENKVAIRGKVPMSEESKKDYQKNMDPLFEKYPKSIKSFASKDWDTFVKKHYEYQE